MCGVALNTLHLQANRNLLVKVFQSNEPVCTEFSIVYGENMKLIDKSDEKGNKIGTYTYHKGIVGRTKIENPGVPYHAFHNHGSGKTFSFPDIFGFARTENMIRACSHKKKKKNHCKHNYRQKNRVQLIIASTNLSKTFDSEEKTFHLVSLFI